VPVPIAAIDRDQRQARGRDGVGVAEIERRVRVAATTMQHHDKPSRRPPLRYGEPPARVVQAEARVEHAVTGENSGGRQVTRGERDADGRSRAKHQRRAERGTTANLAGTGHAGSVEPHLACNRLWQYPASGGKLSLVHSRLVSDEATLNPLGA
jgi:hypothetical protein